MNIFIPERGFPVTDTDQINQDQPSSDLYKGRSNIGKLDRGRAFKSLELLSELVKCSRKRREKRT